MLISLTAQVQINRQVFLGDADFAAYNARIAG
jgi:hypothetical protein